MIREAIEKIVRKEDLTYDEAYTVMNEIMQGKTSQTQNAAFFLSNFKVQISIYQSGNHSGNLWLCSSHAGAGYPSSTPWP